MFAGSLPFGLAPQSALPLIFYPQSKQQVKTISASETRREQEKASVRARAEHPFFYVKRMFGYGKVRYRSLHKNARR